ncbi:MAG: DMT family protein [Pseudomonadota bacterium]
MSDTLARILPIAMLLISNLFMTYAWYGHLKDARTTPLAFAVLASWGVAFAEYCLAVPANRIGASVYSIAQLKAIQEVLALTVFVGFSALYLGQRVTANHLVGFALIGAGAWFIFKGPLGR